MTTSLPRILYRATASRRQCQEADWGGSSWAWSPRLRREGPPRSHRPTRDTAQTLPSTTLRVDRTRATPVHGSPPWTEPQRLLAGRFASGSGDASRTGCSAEPAHHAYDRAVGHALPTVRATLVIFLGRLLPPEQTHGPRPPGRRCRRGRGCPGRWLVSMHKTPHRVSRKGRELRSACRACVDAPIGSGCLRAGADRAHGPLRDQQRVSA